MTSIRIRKLINWKIHSRESLFHFILQKFHMTCSKITCKHKNFIGHQINFTCVHMNFTCDLINFTCDLTSFTCIRTNSICGHMNFTCDFRTCRLYVGLKSVIQFLFPCFKRARCHFLKIFFKIDSKY